MQVRVLFDATILRYGLDQTCSRSGIFVVASELLAEMCRRPGFRPDLYVADDAIADVRRYLNTRSDFRQLRIVNDVNVGLCGRLRCGLQCHRVPPAPERGGRLRQSAWFAYRIFREMCLLTFDLRFARAESRLRRRFLKMVAERYDAYFSPMAMAPDAIRQSRIRRFTVLYDTIPQIYPEIYDDNLGVQWTRDLADALTGQDWCFSISKATTKDFLRFAPGLDEKHVITIPLAAAERFRPCVNEARMAAARSRYGIPAGKRYFLSLCNLTSHKNLPFAIRAFAEFARGNEDVVLVLAGSGWSGYSAEMESTLSSIGEMRKRVILTGYVADDDLPMLYSGAMAFVYLSLYEGFGLPPLEAMQCGTPVVVSDVSSLPEVVGDAGLRVSPTDLPSAVRALKRLANDAGLRQVLRSRGVERCKLFSWRRAVDIISETMLRESSPQSGTSPLRVLFDGTILHDGMKDNANRSGVYVASYEILLALQNRQDLHIDLLVSPEHAAATRRYLAIHPELNRVEMAGIGSGDGYEATAALLEEYVAPSLGYRASAATRLIWFAFLSARWPLIRLARLLHHRKLMERAQILQDRYSAFFSPVLAAPDEVVVSRLARYTVLYDAIPMLFPQFYAHAKGEMWTSVLARRLTSEDRCFAISECTKRDFIKFAPGLKASNVSVVPLAAAERFHPCFDRGRIEAVLNKYGLPAGRPYFLSLCTIEPRKNLATALKAFSVFAKQNNDMVFVLAGGGWDAYNRRWKAVLESVRDVSDRICLPGYVADEDLAPLYSGARAFVYLSLYEGFGLPPLEAMQCGTPVLCSNLSSLPEVVGDAALMVSPSDVPGVTQAMVDLASDDILCESLRRKGLERCQMFTWSRTAEIIHDAMLAGGSGRHEACNVREWLANSRKKRCHDEDRNTNVPFCE